MTRVCFVCFATASILLATDQFPARPISFSVFIESVQNAKAGEFLHQSGAKVKDAAAFEQMRQYILKLYDGVTIRNSYLAGRQTIDCIPESEQPSLRVGGTKRTERPSSNAPTPQGNARQQSTSTKGCVAGTIPMRRITLDEMTRFPSVEGFLHKAPHGGLLLPP